LAQRQKRRTVQIDYIIGVDGGGTGTRARLCRPDGSVLGNGEAGPSALGQGVSQAWVHIQRAVLRAFESAGMRPPPLDTCALGLGLSGAHVQSRRDAFLSTAPAAYARIVLEDDGTTSLYGALQGRAGAVVAAGTGSIGEAVRADGQRVTVNGWGFGIGDEGSGAWLGQRAVRHAHRAQDGREPAGPLAEALWSSIGRTREAMLGWGEGAGQSAYAQLAPLVFEMESRDETAASLLRDAVRALEATARALDPSESLPLVVVGSIGLRLKPRLAPGFRSRLVEPAGDSADGALYLVRRALTEAAQ
jgi:glucosamine kinase